jgi:predicted dehydrogenase
VGGFGEGWLKNHTSRSADFELVGIVDVSQEHLDLAGDLAGIPDERRFSSLEEALLCVNADAVLTVTPPRVHLEHARLAFARGLHVMTEKPIADSIENACEMVRLAKECGRELVVSQQYRFTPFLQKFKELVRSNALGELGHGHIDYYIPMDFAGTFRETMDFPLLLDMAIHHFDLIRSVTGREIVKVTAHSFRPDWSWYTHHSGLKMLIELEGGLPISYSGDWSALGRITSGHGNWRLQCAEGSLHLDNNRIFAERCEKWGQNPSVEEISFPELERADQAATLHLFAEAIRTGVSAEICGQDNLGSFAVVAAAMKSIREGRTVCVDECLPPESFVRTSRSVLPESAFLSHAR